MIINSSRLDTFQRCNRLYFWTSVFDLGGNSSGIRPHRFNEDQKWGEIAHIGLAHYYRGERGEQLLKLYRGEALTALDFDSLDWTQRNTWLENLEWIDRVLQAYEKWAPEEDDFKVISVETPGLVILGEVCYSCGEPYEKDPQGPLHKCGVPIHRLAFMTDLVTEKDGYRRVVDHKTTKSVSEPYLLSWHHSLQLWGYSYGESMRGEQPIRGYSANLIRKLKTIGLPEQTTKQCPDCRNGKNKKVGCATCGGDGLVKKENNPAEKPFQREHESFGYAQIELLIRSRIRTIQDIDRETARFETEPDAAFPMNTTHCFTYGVCPMLKVCWGWGVQNPSEWYNPPIEVLDQFDPQPDNYMTSMLVTEEKR